MFSKLLSSFTALVLATNAVAAPLSAREADVKTASVRQVLQLPKPSWLENIAVRPNGQLLASRLDEADLYLVDPSTGKYSLIASFPGVKGAWGIAEYKPDVYAVNVGNFSAETLSSTKGSYSIYTVDLSKGLGKNGKVTPTLLTNFTEASNLNGLTFKAPNTLYASDFVAFKVYEIDTRTGATKTAIASDPLFTGSPAINLGVNGVRWSDKERSLFFANTGQAIVGVVPQRADGSFAPAQKIATNPVGNPRQASFDDFALDADNNIYAGTNGGTTVNFVSRDGKTQYVLAGKQNSTELAGPTSVAFGRTPKDKNVAYVVTSGGSAAPINGTVTVGAQLAALTIHN